MSALTPEQKDRQKKARWRVNRIRDGIVTYLETLAHVAQAYQERDWDTLGYDSWAEYVNGEYPAEKLGIPAAHRQKAIEELRIAGLSSRAIAPVVGLHPATVARRQVSQNATPEPVQGTDGKTYPPARSSLVDALTGAIEDAEDRANAHREIPVGTESPPSSAGADEPSGASTPAPQTRSEGTPIEAEPESGVVPGSAAESGIPVPDSAPNLPREESGPVAIPPSPDLDQWRDDFQMLIWDARNLMRSPAEVVAEKAGPELLGELARVADDLWSYSEAVAKAAG